MVNNTIKELVKKHFSLIDAPKESFGTIRTADGELQLTYEGEELSAGLPIFIITADGDIPAPDGEHMLEGDITITTIDGKIEEIKETEAPAEEELEEEIVSEEMAEHGDEEEEKMEEEPIEAIAEAVTEEVAEGVSDAVESVIDEEIVAAVAGAVKEVVEEMTKDVEERMKEMEEKLSKFSSAPASEKTIASSFSKKSKEDNYKNASAIEAMIARKTRKG